jgi:hypothetical protein
MFTVGGIVRFSKIRHVYYKAVRFNISENSSELFTFLYLSQNTTNLYFLSNIIKWSKSSEGYLVGKTLESKRKV